MCVEVRIRRVRVCLAGNAGRRVSFLFVWQGTFADMPRMRSGGVVETVCAANASHGVLPKMRFEPFNVGDDNE